MAKFIIDTGDDNTLDVGELERFVREGIRKYYGDNFRGTIDIEPLVEKDPK